MEALVAQYISPEARCKTSGVQEVGSQVTFTEVSGLWILLAGTVAATLLIFAGGQLALCGARRLARTKTAAAFRGAASMYRQNTLGSLRRGGVSFSPRQGGAASTAKANGEAQHDAAADSRAEAGLADTSPEAADPRALSAAVAELAAQLQQALAAQAAAASGGGKAHSK